MSRQGTRKETKDNEDSAREAGLNRWEEEEEGKQNVTDCSVESDADKKSIQGEQERKEIIK